MGCHVITIFSYVSPCKIASAGAFYSLVYARMSLRCVPRPSSPYGAHHGAHELCYLLPVLAQEGVKKEH